MAGLLSSAIFSPSGDTVLTSSGDCEARLFDVETEECRRVFVGHEETASWLAATCAGCVVAGFFLHHGKVTYRANGP